jgi:hypothetical protein
MKHAFLKVMPHCRYRWNATQYGNTVKKQALGAEMDEQV